MNGHWFCSYCNEVQFSDAPVGRWDSKKGEACPTCRHNSMDWIEDAKDEPAPVPPASAAYVAEKLHMFWCGACHGQAVTHAGGLCPDCYSKAVTEETAKAEFAKIRKAIQ